MRLLSLPSVYANWSCTLDMIKAVAWEMARKDPNRVKGMNEERTEREGRRNKRNEEIQEWHCVGIEGRECFISSFALQCNTRSHSVPFCFLNEVGEGGKGGGFAPCK